MKQSALASVSTRVDFLRPFFVSWLLSQLRQCTDPTQQKCWVMVKRLQYEKAPVYSEFIHGKNVGGRSFMFEEPSEGIWTC